MPLLGSIMTIAVDSATTASTSVFEENMTWSRPTGGSTSTSYEAALSTTRAIPSGEQLRRRAATATSSDRDSRLLIDGIAQLPASGNDGARNNEKHIESGERDIATGEGREVEEEEEAEEEEEEEEVEKKEEREDEEKATTAAREVSHRCGQTSETRVYGGHTVGATKSGETAFTGEENNAVGGIGAGGGGEEESVDGVGSTTVGVGASISNSTEEEEEEDDVSIESRKDLLLFGISDTMEDVDSFNDTYNASTRYPWNVSLYNETFVVLGEGMYPSGYTLPEIILASIVATLLMIVIIVGNMLVIIAIATEKALKNIQNWFIASLAVADFFLGLVIMPFSLANEIMGYWIFGYWWCDIYSAMDVLLCTASIMNLCLISLDRFWSITQAVDYLKKRTPARAALMIALVWLLSALVCIPPLLGWKRPTPAEEYPKCKVSPKAPRDERVVFRNDYRASTCSRLYDVNSN